MDDLHQTRIQAKRLERFAYLVKDKIWRGDRRDLIGAMTDVAEAAEIARRLYNTLARVIKESSD
jgi:hypothetical protein